MGWVELIKGISPTFPCALVINRIYKNRFGVTIINFVFFFLEKIWSDYWDILIVILEN
jgi:hypothetical protein